MDVHDVGDYRRPLEAGMAFVIEPGLYIRQEALEQLPDTPENRAFREKVGAGGRALSGIGVRIEDSFLLTDKELVRLSAKVPRTLRRSKSSCAAVVERRRGFAAAMELILFSAVSLILQC